MINKEKVKRVANFIRENPQGFHMNYLFSDSKGECIDIPTEPLETILEKLYDGEIRACIAGLACLFDEVPYRNVGADKAAEILAGNADEHLFFVSRWSYVAQDKWATLVTDEEKASFAAGYMLEYYGITEEQNEK